MRPENNVVSGVERYSRGTRNGRKSKEYAVQLGPKKKNIDQISLSFTIRTIADFRRPAE